MVQIDRRENKTSRSNAFFAPDIQLVPVLRDWERFFASTELELRLAGANRAALGVRYEDTRRDLDFAEGALRIFENNALVNRDSESFTLYGRTSVRPVRGLRLNAELGYREAPETGYVTEEDDHVDGTVRATQVLAFKRPVVLSGFLNGSRGENRDFRMVPAQGELQTGPQLKRSHDRWNLRGGLTASHSPVDSLHLFVSGFYGRDERDSSLDLSSFQRYFQNQGLSFSRDGHSRLRNRNINLVLGSVVRLDARSNARLSYTYTHAKVRYADAASLALGRIRDTALLDSQIHAVDVELRHQLRAGLELSAGYRLQRYDDDAPVVESIASAARPFDRSTHQHTVTLGVTLTSALFNP